MTRTPLGILLVVLLAGAGLFAPPAAGAYGPPPQGDGDPYLAGIGEATGMRAVYTPDAPDCVYDAGYAVYLCPEAAPATLPVRDPAAAALAHQVLQVNGLLLVPDSTADRVMAFDPLTGNLIDADFIPADPTHLSTPKKAIPNAAGDAILVIDQIDDVVQAYDLDGNYIGVFAPAGGPNPAIIDNATGIALRPNGNLLVTVTGGANADAVAEFDTSGNYLGNFIAIGAGGMDGPFDLAMRTADWLVSAINSDNVVRFDLTGAFLNVFAPINNFPQQVAFAANDNVLIGNFGGTQEGVVELTPAGAVVGVYNPAAIGGNRGAYELPNGNILTTNGTGVYEIDRAGAVVSTKISGVSGQYIFFLPPTGLELVKTVGTDAGTCATTTTITVPPGTAVTYCFEITNSGSITYTEHDLIDSHLGTLLSNFPYVLAPGASAFLTQTATITQTTTNIAAWTATDGTITNTVTVSATATVNVAAAPPVIAVTPGTFELTVPQGYYAPVTQPMSIGNTGGSDLTWTITEENGTNPGSPQVVLYDNGPLVTHPGGGAGGADASALQTALGLNIYGFGHALSSGYRVADDFTIADPGGWTVDTITFYAYQTGSGTTPSINHINLRIWNGPPNNPASVVVFGDTTTNRLASAGFSNIYRVLDTALTNADRPVMAVVATIGTALPAGTYWLDWQVGGTLASGPWAPPISILGQTTTGNALQWDTAAWYPLLDGGTSTQQDLPFTIDGPLAGSCSTVIDIPWLSTNPTGGTTLPGASTPVDVIYGNMSALAVGTYTGRLCVNSNDPVTPLVTVPVTLTITTPTAVALTGVTASTTFSGGWLAIPLAAVAAAAVAVALRRKRG